MTTHFIFSPFDTQAHHKGFVRQGHVRHKEIVLRKGLAP